jgi:3-hydroxyisobutyrate dehydrogenase-like beta-hydroxyacid dehydrogenase
VRQSGKAGRAVRRSTCRRRRWSARGRPARGRGLGGEAVEGAEVVITMLPAGPHVRKVYEEQVFGKGAPRARC